MTSCRTSVILCTHNPDPAQLTRALHALLRQSADPESWELILVDNASATPVNLPAAAEPRSKLRLVREPRLGLNYARWAGLNHARGEFLVMIDDECSLHPTYLETVCQAFARMPRLGALGGKSLPEFERAPEPWKLDFGALLALRDLGEKEQFCLPPTAGNPLRLYPACAPLGSGMALRREALDLWRTLTGKSLADRNVPDASGASEMDLVIHVLNTGWAVGYVPNLVLTRRVPASKLENDHLARLNHTAQKTAVAVLEQHGLNPWPPISRSKLRLLQWNAWWEQRAWRGSAAQIQWKGVCGQLEARAASRTKSVRQ